jgi:hypothetical protein
MNSILVLLDDLGISKKNADPSSYIKSTVAAEKTKCHFAGA